jgi:hypothetical protein
MDTNKIGLIRVTSRSFVVVLPSSLVAATLRCDLLFKTPSSRPFVELVPQRVAETQPPITNANQYPAAKAFF